MISIGTPEGNAIRCPVCANIASAADVTCSKCGNTLVFLDPTLMTIALSAIPVLDRELIERMRKLVSDVKPQKLRIDFEKVQLPSAAVFGSFLVMVKELKKTGTVIAIRNVDPQIQQMFVMMRVDGLMETESV